MFTKDELVGKVSKILSSKNYKVECINGQIKYFVFTYEKGWELVLSLKEEDIEE